MEKESAGITVYHQARNNDYKGNRYHRGHLAPVCHSSSQSCANATFTLTNAAPQVGSFNSKWFHYTEKPMAEFLEDQCIDKGLRAYVVTGVVPGDTTLNNRVRIPSHFWAAFCCLDNNNKSKHSGGCIGKNRNGSTPTRTRVQDLETTLTSLYTRYSPSTSPSRFTLFGGGCYEEFKETEENKKICSLIKHIGRKRKRLWT